jgi:hypothetical protein
LSTKTGEFTTDAPLLSGAYFNKKMPYLQQAPIKESLSTSGYGVSSPYRADSIFIQETNDYLKSRTVLPGCYLLEAKIEQPIA